MNINAGISLACVLGVMVLSGSVQAANASGQVGNEEQPPVNDQLEIPGTEARGLEGGEEKAIEVGKKLEVVGLLEMKYGMSRGDSGHVNGPRADKAEVGVTYKPTDKFDLNAVLLYEDKKFSADEAKVTWHALPDDKLDITAGKQYVPFGSFESSMVSDPITKVLGETRRNKVIQASSTWGNLHTAAYVFDGTSPKTGGTGTHKSGYGLSVGYGTDKASGGVDYLSNLAESKLFGNTNNATNKVPALSIHGVTKIGRFSVSGEHMAAMKAFQPGDLDGMVTVAAKPSVTHLEADLDLNHDRTVAVAWNGSSNAQEIGLVKDDIGVTYRQPIYKDLNGGLELKRSKGYDGVKDNVLTAQLSYEF
jgi:hypothetical protein